MNDVDKTMIVILFGICALFGASITLISAEGTRDHITQVCTGEPK